MVIGNDNRLYEIDFFLKSENESIKANVPERSIILSDELIIVKQNRAA